MATQAQPQPLSALVKTWDTRLRWQRTAQWFARSLMPGLIVAIIIGVISRTRPLLNNPQIGVLALLGMLIGASILWAWVWFLPHQAIKSARRFDVQFGLQERISTALELTEGRIHANEVLTPRQIENAHATASTIDPVEQLPIRINHYEWVIVLMLAFMVALLVLLPNAQARATGQNAAGRQVISEAADEVRDAIEEIAIDTTLEEAERESLLESLQTSLETLEDENVTEEEAAATMNDVEELLNQEASSLNEQAQRQQQALEQAAEALGEPEATSENPPQQQPADQQSSAAEEAQQSLAEMMEEMEQMTQEEAESLAQQLEQAADALQETAPEAAESLREAAEALRNGDQQSAQDAMQDASDQIQEAGQEQERTQRSAQQMAESAQDMQESQQAMGMQQPQQQEQQGEQGESGQQQQGQSEGQPQEGQQGESSDGPPQEGQEGQQQGSGEGNQQSPPNPGETQGQQGSAQNPPDSSSNEIGDQPGSQFGDTSGFADTGEEQQGGGTAGGEGIFEEIFAPRAPEVPAGSDEIILQPDTGDTPLREGDLSDNPSGAVTVPYNQVFSDYANSANRALDQDYIPLGLRDVVREYFTSLAPRGSSNDQNP